MLVSLFLKTEKLEKSKISLVSNTEKPAFTGHGPYKIWPVARKCWFLCFRKHRNLKKVRFPCFRKQRNQQIWATGHITYGPWPVNACFRQHRNLTKVRFHCFRNQRNLTNVSLHCFRKRRKVICWTIISGVRCGKVSFLHFRNTINFTFWNVASSSGCSYGIVGNVKFPTYYIVGFSILYMFYVVEPYETCHLVVTMELPHIYIYLYVHIYIYLWFNLTRWISRRYRQLRRHSICRSHKLPTHRLPSRTDQACTKIWCHEASSSTPHFLHRLLSNFRYNSGWDWQSARVVGQLRQA